MKKKILSILLSLCMIASIFTALPITVSAAASGTCGNELTWVIDGDTLTISGSGDMNNFSWSNRPDWEKGQPKNVVIEEGVTSIGNYAFYQSSIEYITIPNTVKSIGNNAFSDSALMGINIPNSVETLGRYLFEDCNWLTSVTIGDGVSELGYMMFYDCRSLTNVHFGAGIAPSDTSELHWTFYRCENLKQFTVSEDNEYYSAKEDGHLLSADGTTLIIYAQGQENENFEIPSYVTTIGALAFEECYNLKRISIHKNVTEIEDWGFDSCPDLLEFTVDSENENYTAVDGVLYSKDKTKVVRYPQNIANESFTVPNTVKTIVAGAFYSTNNLKNVTIPDSVEKIGDSAFYYSYTLENVTIGNGVKLIDEYAFSDCEGLESVTIGNKVEIIGDYSFNCCISLKSLTIPDSVKTIGEGAFGICFSLECVTMGKNLETIGSSAFYACNAQSIIIPDSVKSIGAYAFCGSLRLSSITLGNSVESVDDGTFTYCPALESVTIPNSVKSIGISAFAECEALKNVSIGSGVETIGESAFSWCTSLKDIVIPDSVKYIGGGAFYQCEILENVIIGNGVEIIDYGAFGACTALTTVTIPKGIIDVGCGVFDECEAIAEVYFTGTEYEWRDMNNRLFADDGLEESLGPYNLKECIPETATFHYSANATVDVQDMIKSISKDGNTITVVINNTSQTPFTAVNVIIGIYDDNGILTAVKTVREKDFWTNVQRDVEVEFDEIGEGSKIKAFLWNGISPLANVKEIL